MLSHIASRLTEKDQVLGHIGHPVTDPGDAGPGWPVSGAEGVTSLHLQFQCLLIQCPGSASHGARLRPQASLKILL